MYNVLKSILTIVFLLSLTSCNKTKEEIYSYSPFPENGIPLNKVDFDNLIIPEDQKANYKEALKNSNRRQIGLMSSSINGKFSKNNDPFSIMGNFMDDIVVDIAEHHIKGMDFNSNMVTYKHPNLKNLFGKQHVLKLTANGKSQEYSAYIQNYLQVTPLEQESEGFLRNPIMTWNPDLPNPFPYILLQYTITEINQQSVNEKVLENGVILLEDDGEFDLSHIFSDHKNVQIMCSFSRMQAFIHNDIAFHVKSSDHHQFYIP